jgi:hypothetical protein
VEVGEALSGKHKYTNYRFGTAYLKKGTGEKSRDHLIRDMLKIVVGLRLQGKTEDEILKMLEGEVQ